MRLVIILLFSFISFETISQVAPKRPVRIKVYSKEGKLLKKDSKGFEWIFEYEHYSRKAQLKENQVSDTNGFAIKLDYGEYFTIKAINKKEEMIIHSSENIDSIPFMPGEFYFNRALSFLINIKPGNGVEIENFSWDQFKKQIDEHPVFELEENEEADHTETPKCYKMASKIEEKHGGKNWARNICNDVYEEPEVTVNNKFPLHTDSARMTSKRDIRTQVYPLTKNRYLRHNFYLGNSYDHDFSISEDGVNWKIILTLKNEWYVNLVYFINEDKVGIDISNSGVFLLSDFNLTSWKYYIQKYDDEDPSGNKDAFVFTGDWMDSHPVRIKFSE